MAKKQRRITGYLRPVLFKYFIGDLNLKKEKDYVKGESELLNNILDKHYASLTETQKNELLNHFKK